MCQLVLVSYKKKEKTSAMYVETDTTNESSKRRSVSPEDGVDAPLRAAAAARSMFRWSDHSDRWRRCSVTFEPPCLHVHDYDDLAAPIIAKPHKQLQHLQEKWYHSNLTRKEARYVLKDFGGGEGSFLVRSSESYNGKFALSFIYQAQVRHVVVDSRRDPVFGVLYSFVPEGPAFPTLCELIEEARQSPLIQNHQFSVKLTNSPPKPDQRWMHRSIKSLSQAEKIMSSEQRDGAFFVYHTKSDFAPYIIAYRHRGDTRHNLIVANQQSYTLNNVSAPVLYKLIHYFMENPINGETCLKYPIEEKETIDNGVVQSPFPGQMVPNELAISTNVANSISPKSPEQSGNCRNKHKVSAPSRYNYEKSSHGDGMALNTKHKKYTFNIQTDYRVSFRSNDTNSTVILLEPLKWEGTLRGLTLCCNLDENIECWKQALSCTSQAADTPKKQRKRSCIIC